MNYRELMSYKKELSKIYNDLNSRLVLPEDFEETEEDYMELPEDTKKIIDDMKILEQIGFKLMEAEARKNLQYEKSLKSRGNKKDFDYHTKGDILITNDNKSYHVIRHGHAAMLLGRGKIVEAVRDGVREYEYKWADVYNSCFAARVKGANRKMPGESKTIAEIAPEWAARKQGRPYKISADKNRTDTFYCSQLVYRSYLSASKSTIDLSEGKLYIWPMGLYYNDNTYSVAYYIKNEDL